MVRTSPSYAKRDQRERERQRQHSEQIRAWPGYSKAPGVSQEPVYDVVKLVPKAGFEPARGITPNGF